jgi:hypothetical protein
MAACKKGGCGVSIYKSPLSRHIKKQDAGNVQQWKGKYIYRSNL